ncbi:pentapeptide repeat-containing protein [Rothia dentocariosa]|uniref:pentapeptide repeat-containing protein n=1 Tax=Rothia dentocariosa TaxID=2047 RepID=UPI001455D115|nr:pentapeptide repeat-containing protein [Rothia dentocariosa]NLR26477.1 pentapeptide repeat-containing protein [Rothia dentocariosa]
MVETLRDNEETNATNPVGKIENFVSKHFVRLLVWLAVSGGALAIFGPWLLYVAGWTGETDANLRLHILYVAGGTIAVLGLVETHRKNTTDRIKADADIQNYHASQSYQSKTLDEQARQFTENIAKEREKIEADKAKNEQDHIRQVHAERRSRYTTAIEQLSSNKASIRLGGVYTLVGLVDEWLSDEKAIHNIEERRKEGQVIINNLCAYIRSPFDLASKHKELSKDQAPENYEGGTEQFNEDQAKFRGEKELRTTILDAIRTRLNGGTIIQEGETKKFLKGPWSDFDYDFSNAHFFYSTNFARNRFGALSNFSRATFAQSANFIGEVFTPSANFIGAAFAQSADFSRATFEDKPKFVYALDNKTYKARFSHKAKPKNYRFKVSYYSPYKIEIREQEHNGIKFITPEGTELFDPDEHSGQKFPNNI